MQCKFNKQLKLPIYQKEVFTHPQPRCTGPCQILKVTGRNVKFKHCANSPTNTASLRHIKSAYLRAGDDQLEDSGATVFTEGKIVIVRLDAAKKAVRKWQVCKLTHTTLDEDAWVVKWYHSHDDGLMLSKIYFPAWEKPDGTKIFSAERTDPSWVCAVKDEGRQDPKSEPHMATETSKRCEAPVSCNTPLLSDVLLLVAEYVSQPRPSCMYITTPRLMHTPNFKMRWQNAVCPCRPSRQHPIFLFSYDGHLKSGD